MNDEEFKKKLESILENLYRIDREVREYLHKEKLVSKNTGYKQESYGYEDPKSAENHKK
jgi:hypothetical protein